MLRERLELGEANKNMMNFTRAIRLRGCRNLSKSRSSKSRPQLVLTLVALVGMAVASHALANVTGEGDVSPAGPTDLPLSGGAATADVIVGDTSFGRLTIDAPAFTDPLESGNGLIGNTVTGVGLVTVSGFDLDQSTWDVDTLLAIGVFGQGILDVTGGGRISVGDGSVSSGSGSPGTFTTGTINVGDELFSQGSVNVNGFASILETFNLIVADNGFGTLDVSNRGNLRTEVASIGNQANAVGRVTLTGLGTRWTHATTGAGSNDLIIGEDGRGTLEIFDQAIVTLTEDARIGNSAGSYGVVTVRGPGSLWKVGDDSGTDNLDVGVSGTAELYIDDGGLVWVEDNTTVAASSFVDLSGGGILNSSSLSISGVVRGDGQIQSAATVSSSGSLRNAAGVANQREYMLVTGAVTNNGTIESQGGEMEFQSAVTNNFEMVARDAIMRFNAGLINSFSLTLGGDTTIYGPVTNVGGGDVHVLSDSETLLVGDLTFSASSTLSLSIGDAPGTLDVLGLTTLNGAMLELDYSAGVEPQAGDSYQVFSSGDGLLGTFSNTSTAAGGLFWDISYSPSGSVFVTAAGLAPTLLGNFDGDSDIDGADFLAWQSGFGTTYTSADLIDWETNYGTVSVPLVAAVTTGAIPEPSSIALLLLGGILLAGRRSRAVS